MDAKIKNGIIELFFRNFACARRSEITEKIPFSCYFAPVPPKLRCEGGCFAGKQNPVAITNVMVGSLGDYGPVSNVVDIGPHLDAATNNFPGANMHGEEKEYQVDISNVFYELVIPDIWITPREVVTNVGDSNVQYTVTGTNIPQGVNWTLIPSGLEDGAEIQASNDWHFASITPGNVGTNYKVRATSVDNTNFYDQVDLMVRKVDIVETNIYISVSNTATLHLTDDSSANTEWEIIPELQNGAYIEGSDSGTSVVINAGSIPTNYTVKAYAEDLTNCFDTCTVVVVKIDIDTDTDNDGTIESDDNGEDLFEEYDSGRILCVNGFGINTNTDYLAEIKLAVQPALTNGSAKLEAIEGGSRIKVWTTTNKTTEITLPKTYDLSSTNPPNSLFVDGIATGKVMLAWSYSCDNFACTDKVAMLVIPTISYAPGKAATAYVWAPLKTEFNNNSGNNLGWDDATEFENQIEDQGWPSVTWLEDTTGDTDADFGTCSLANYKGIVNGGIYTIVSHGEMGGHPAVYAKYSSEGLAAISNWCSGESGITIEPWDPDPYDPDWTNGCYVARVSSSWLSANWKSAMNGNRAISFWSICYSATSNSVTGEDAVKECAGGRWRVGYIDSTSESEAEIVNERILTRMNGSADSAKKRTAGEAYENGNGYTGNVKMDGNDWTTLCPAPLADNATFPDVVTDNRKGWGCIIFDTYMSQSYSANEALVKQSGCPTDDHRWFGNADGKYGLGFDFDKTGGASTTMRAVPDKCRNEGVNGGRQLDGNRVKPSEDNRDWSF